MNGPSRRLTPEKREQIAGYVDHLIYGLFGERAGPFFDRGSVPPKLIDEFAQRDEVVDATYQFIMQLRDIWKTRYPGKELKLSALPPKRDDAIKLLTPPDFSPPVASQPASPRTAQNQQQPAAEPRETGDAAVLESLMTPTPPAAPPPDTPAHPNRNASKAPIAPPDPRVSFQLPNARACVEYVYKIEARTDGGGSARVLEVRIPPGLGLSFDPASGELRGTPALDGDHRLAVRWTSDGRTSYSSDALLIVNPDPRSLWKVIEPPADAPYPKPHADCRLLTSTDRRIAAASRRGRSHEHAGSFRDDDFFIHIDPDTDWNIILVADGAGSAACSRAGSRLVVTAAGAHLAAQLAGDFGARMSHALAEWDADPETAVTTIGTDFHYLFHKAGLLGAQAIEQEAQAQGRAIRDYATTLLAAAVKRQGSATFLATFWMGDGAIAAYGPRGRVRLMGTPDAGEFAGQTRFLDRAALSEPSFAKRIGIGRYPELAAVLLMTDGVSDPYFETDTGLNDPVRWDRLWDDLAPALQAPEPERALVDWLGFFAPGHHDDRTLALLW